MNVDAFNSELSAYTGEFIKNWFRLVDEFSESNTIEPSDKIMCLLYSHLGIEKRLSAEVWDTGSEFMNRVIKIVEEDHNDI